MGIKEREKLHRLVDELDESEVLAAERFLVFLHRMRTDPLFRALMEAPIDDEPETEEERQAVQEAREAMARGEVVPWEEVRPKFLGHK